MKKRLISALILAAYSALLVKLLVFKTVSFKIGHLMFNFTGTSTGPANFVPLKTIAPYVRGEKGLVIAAFELGGNIALFVPIGLLVPFVFPNMTWQRSLTFAVAAPLLVEITQVVFRMGIFDIDDILLNALGVMVGYVAFVVLAKWMPPSPPTQ